METSRKPQKKKRGFGRTLINVVIGLLVVSGVAVIAYPFLLTGIVEHNKNEVVAQLEAELPIFRDEADFEPVDIEAMVKVDTPVWTAEEMAQAGQPMGVWETMVGEDTRQAIGSLLGNEQKSNVAHLPSGALPTLIPQVLDPSATLAPEALAPTEPPAATPVPTPLPTDEPVEGIEVLATRAPTSAPLVAAAGDATEAPQVAATNAQQNPAFLNAGGDTPLTQAELTLAEERRLALEAFLKEQAPVYYEDFETVPRRAEALTESLSETALANASARPKEIPEEVGMTFQGIQSQFLATQSLFSVMDSLPSAETARAIFVEESGGEEHAVVIQDGVDLLRKNLTSIAQAHVQAQLVSVYPAAFDDVNLALDEIVHLGDQVQNQLDYMAQYLSESDLDLYMRYRASSRVGETEALYLLEIPAVNLKVGCFQDLTFEQMYKSMRKGAALFPRVGSPNTNTNVTMSAHRAGSAAFFEEFDKLEPGDEILLHTRTLGSFRYLVDEVFIVEEDDWTTTETLGYPALTLISCEEYRGITHGRRIVVRARLVGIARI